MGIGTSIRRALRERAFSVKPPLRLALSILLSAGVSAHAAPGAALALDGRDTAAALENLRAAWKHSGSEDDFLTLIDLHRARKDLDDMLLEQGLRVHPASPTVNASVFAAYMEAQNPDRVQKALALAARCESELWPKSVDWKMRHAQALLASGRSKEAEAHLVKALAVLDADPAFKPGTSEAVRLRQEIFALFDAVQAKR